MVHRAGARTFCSECPERGAADARGWRLSLPASGKRDSQILRSSNGRVRVALHSTRVTTGPGRPRVESRTGEAKRCYVKAVSCALFAAATAGLPQLPDPIRCVPASPAFHFRDGACSTAAEFTGRTSHNGGIPGSRGGNYIGVARKQTPCTRFVFPDVREAAFCCLPGHEPNAWRIAGRHDRLEAHDEHEITVSTDELDVALKC